MKKFIYCESTEGGMEEYYIDSLEELGLYGWMSETCKEEDNLDRGQPPVLCILNHLKNITAFERVTIVTH